MAAYTSLHSPWLLRITHPNITKQLHVSSSSSFRGPFLPNAVKAASKSLENLPHLGNLSINDRAVLVTRPNCTVLFRLVLVRFGLVWFLALFSKPQTEPRGSVRDFSEPEPNSGGTVPHRFGSVFRRFKPFETEYPHNFKISTKFLKFRKIL